MRPTAAAETTARARQPPPRRPHPLWLTVEELAELLDVSERTVWTWEAAGQIPRAYRKGTHWTRWKRAEIDQHIAAMPAGPAAAAAGPEKS
jgi:excisionase family DNA binding protein